MRKSTGLIKEIFSFSFFSVLAFAAMYPVMFSPGNMYFGHAGDSSGAIWWFWWAKKAIFEFGANPEICPYLAAPIGSDLSQLPNNVLTHHFFPYFLRYMSPVTLFNTVIFATFLFSGHFMYLFISYLTGRRMIGLLAGTMYALSPFHMVRTFGHIMLANIQWFPLMLLFILKCYRENNAKYLISAALTYAMLFLTNYYFGFIGACLIGALGLFFVYDVVRNKNTLFPAKLVKFFIVVLGSAMIIATGVLAVYPFAKSIAGGKMRGHDAYESEGITKHPVKELHEYSIRPFSYFMPAYYHPVFGGLARSFIGSVFYGTSKTEHTQFLGFTALAFLVYYLRQRASQKADERFSRQYGLWILAVGVLCSFPPTVPLGLFDLHFPSYFTYRILPMFRNPARFGLLTFIGVIVLSSLGIRRFLEKRPGAVYPIAIGCLIVMDFLFIPARHHVDAKDVSGVYFRLKNEPGDFIICEYPMYEGVGTYGPYYYAQTIHGKRIANGALVGAPAFQIKEKLLRLEDPATVDLLAALGVRYILVHREEMRRSSSLDVIGALPDFGGMRGLRHLNRYGDIDLYELTGVKG